MNWIKIFSFMLGTICPLLSGKLLAQCADAAFTSAENQVISAYIAYYGRIPDTAGFSFWSDEVSQQGSLESIIESFGNSEEFESNFGDLETEALVNNLYLQAFSRNADEAGLAFYVNELNNGTITLQEIAVTIMQGVQGDDETIIKHKIEVAQHYLIQAEDQGIEFTESQMDGLLSDVTTDHTSTIQACEAITDSIEVLVAEQEDDEFFSNNSCDNGSEENEPTKKTATLTGVSGLSYTSESVTSVAGVKKTTEGVTGLNGEFDYYEVCSETATVAFCTGVKKNCGFEEEVVSGVEFNSLSLGRRILGVITSPEDKINFRTIIEQSFPNRTNEERLKIRRNIYRLLLTLDEDSDQKNGIALNETIRTRLEDVADHLDFTLTNFENDPNIINLINNLGKTMLVAQEQADSFEASLAQLSDTYTVAGTISGLEGPITLELNGQETITTFPRTFSFTTRLATGDSYQVQIKAIPDGFECITNSAQGLVQGEPITSVRVLCREAQDESSTGLGSSIEALSQ